MNDPSQYDNKAFEEEEEEVEEEHNMEVAKEEDPVVAPRSKKSGAKPPMRGESVPLLFASIHAGNIEGVRTMLDNVGDLINSSSYGGLTPLHAACHMKHIDILKLLISRGAKVSSLDSLGNAVLHSAVKEKWHEGIRELLYHGASPNQMSQPPSSVSGVTSETPLHTAVKTGDKIATSLFLQYQPDLSIRDGNNCSVLHLAASKRNVVILKDLLADEELTKYLKDMEKDGNSIYHAALSGDINEQNEPQILKVIQAIYNCYNNLNHVNLFGETPLLLACRVGLHNVVKFLLNNGADPTQVTREGQSTLHAACFSGCQKTLRHLLNTGRVGHLIVQVDAKGHHPFYFAVESSSVECCKLLLSNGEHLAHVGNDGKSNCTLVIEKLPSAMQLFRDLFDSGVKLSKKPQHDPTFSITFDYSVLMLSEKEKIQCSIISELAGTPLEPLIKHPLIESFLYIKWCRIRRIFYTNVTQVFMYLLLHTSFVLLTFGPEPKDWSKAPQSLITFKIFHIIFLLILLGPGVLVTVANYKKYLLQWETYTRLVAMVSSAVTISLVSDQIIDDDITKKDIINDTVKETTLTVQRGFASVSVFFGWVELMMLLGRFPTLGAYILMFTKVGKSVFKFLLAFLSLLLGFSLSFHILFQRLIIFADYKLSFVKTLMMMTGEIAYSEFIDKEGVPFNVYCLIFLSMFLFMVTIIMSNLLIGLAVTDIPELKRQGKIKRLVKQASYLVAYERLLEFTYKIPFFPRKLRSFMTSRLSIKSVLTIQPHNEFRKNKYMQTIPDENIREAIMLGSCDKPEDFPTDADEGVDHQLKSFQIRYSSDRRIQKHKFTDLSDMCIDIRKQIDQLKLKTDSQLSHITMQLQQQIQQNQNLYNQLSHKRPG